MYAFIVVGAILAAGGAEAVEMGNIGGALLRSLAQCSADDNPQHFGLCVRLKAVTLVDTALSSDRPIPITAYVAIARDPAVQLNTTGADPLTERQLDDSLSGSPLERAARLDDMLEQRVATFLGSRTLQFTVPGELEQGRRKKDKGGMMMMAAVAMGGMLMQMAMAKIALLAGKALLIGKIALLLSAVIGLKKLIGGGGGGGEAHQVVYATEAGHGGGWSRSWGDGDVVGLGLQGVAARGVGTGGVRSGREVTRSLGDGNVEGLGLGAVRAGVEGISGGGEGGSGERQALHSAQADQVGGWARSLMGGEVVGQVVGGGGAVEDDIGGGTRTSGGAQVMAYGGSAPPVQPR